MHVSKRNEEWPLTTNKPRSSQRYQTVWRWHFYAGLLISPILLLLAITGGLYLFKGNIEASMYSEYRDVTPDASGITLAPSELIGSALLTYEEVETIRSYSPSEEPTKSVELGATFVDGSTSTIFMNPIAVRA